MGKYTPEQIRGMALKIKATSKDPAALAKADRALSMVGAAPVQPLPGPVGELDSAVTEGAGKVGAGEAFARSAGEGFIPGMHNLMGLGNTIGEYLGGKFTDAPVKKDLDTAFMQEENKPREDLARAKQDHPKISLAGDILGTGVGLLGAGAGSLTRGVTGAAERVAPRLAASRLGRVGLGTVTGALTGAGNEAIKSAAEGGDASEIGRRTAGGAVGGAAFGTILHSFADGAEMANAASAGMRARNLITSNGGKVGLFNPGSEGPFTRELAGLPANDDGIATAARQSSARLLSREEDMLGRDLAPHLEAKAALDEGSGATNRVVVNDLYEKLVRLSNDKGLSRAQRARVAEWVTDNIEPHEVVTADGTRTGVFAMPETEVNKLRQKIDGQLPDDPSTVAEASMGKAGEASRAAVDETAYAGPNKGIHEARNRYEQRRNMLSVAKRPANSGVTAPEDTRLPETEVAKVTNMLARDEHKTTTVGARNAVGAQAATDVEAGVDGLPAGKRFELYSRLVPEDMRAQVQQDINAPKILNAKSDLSAQFFKHKGKGGLIGHIPEIGGATATAAAALTGHPKLALAASIAALLARNAVPIQGRAIPAAISGMRLPANAMLMEEFFQQAMRDRQRSDQ